MSEFNFYALFWVPLGFGLAFYLALYPYFRQLKYRVIVTLVFLCVATVTAYVGLIDRTSLDNSNLLIGPLIAVATVGPTFLVPSLAYEITSMLTPKTWIKVAVSAIVGVPMVAYSVLFFFAVGCMTTGDCL